MFPLNVKNIWLYQKNIVTLQFVPILRKNSSRNDYKPKCHINLYCRMLNMEYL